MEKERQEVVEEMGKRGRGEKVLAVVCAMRSAAEPGTESGDGYRGSSAIIGAESSSFFPSSSFFFPFFFSTSDIDLGEAVRIRGTSVPRDSRRRRRRRRRRRDASRRSAHRGARRRPLGDRLGRREGGGGLG